MLTTTKAHPIHYTKDNRQARREGRKTQTRRAMLIQPPNDEYSLAILADTTDTTRRKYRGYLQWVKLDNDGINIEECSGVYFHCPHGQIGDFLYIHEPIEFVDIYGQSARIRYIDDGPEGAIHIVKIPDRVKYPPLGIWKGRTIPLEWGRDFDEITNIRVERLLDITDNDALAEGIQEEPHVNGPRYKWGNQRTRRGFWTPKLAYLAEWDHLNGKEFPHASNPWVWVIDSKVLPKI